jgi:hypothetical protein
MLLNLFIILRLADPINHICWLKAMSHTFPPCFDYIDQSIQADEQSFYHLNKSKVTSYIKNKKGNNCLFEIVWNQRAKSLLTGSIPKLHS